MKKPTAIRPSGFSPKVCVRRLSNRAEQFGECRSRNINNPLVNDKNSEIIYKALRPTAISQSSRTPVTIRWYTQVSPAETPNDGLPVPNNVLETSPNPLESLDKLKVKELRFLLQERGLKVSGLKVELIERLRQASTPTVMTPVEVENEVPSSKELETRPQQTDYSTLIENIESTIHEIETSVNEIRLSASTFQPEESFISATLTHEESPLPETANPAIAEVQYNLNLSELQNRILFSDLDFFLLYKEFKRTRNWIGREALKAARAIEKENANANARREFQPLIFVHLPFMDESIFKDVRRDLLKTEFLIHNLHLQVLQVLSPQSLPDAAMRKRLERTAEQYFGKILKAAKKRGPDELRGLDLVGIRPKHRAQFLDKQYMPIIRRKTAIKFKLTEEDMKEAWDLALYRFAKGMEVKYLAVPEIIQPKKQVTRLEVFDEQVPDDEPWSKSQLLREQIIELAANPVDIQVTISPRHRQSYLRGLDSHFVIGEKAEAAVNNNLDMILEPMWKRMGLMDYVVRTRQGETDHDLIVTFSRFEAAASFVNRCDEHWVGDQFSGQVYATWMPGSQDEQSVTAIVNIPGVSLKTWRQVALDNGITPTKWGFPIIDWGKSLSEVLKRMHFKIGRYEEVRRYRVLAEYSHRVVMDVSFDDVEGLNRFLAAKSEHYLANPWKDRFFAKRLSWVG